MEVELVVEKQVEKQGEGAVETALGVEGEGTALGMEGEGTALGMEGEGTVLGMEGTPLEVLRSCMLEELHTLREQVGVMEHVVYCLTLDKPGTHHQVTS